MPHSSQHPDPPHQIIYDVDDDNALINPEAGVPHAAASHTPASTTTFAVGPEAFVHNPYGCFGGPANVWPRGFPLDSINDPDSTRCDEVAVDASGEEVEEPWRLGVVQTLANHDPDVDAVYRLTYPPGGLPFDFPGGQEPVPEGESPLKIVPPAAFTPYNAQVRGGWVARKWVMGGWGFCWVRGARCWVVAWVWYTYLLRGGYFWCSRVLLL